MGPIHGSHSCQWMGITNQLKPAETQLAPGKEPQANHNDCCWWNQCAWGIAKFWTATKTMIVGYIMLHLLLCLTVAGCTPYQTVSQTSKSQQHWISDLLPNEGCPKTPCSSIEIIATPIGLMEHLQERRSSQKSKGVALTLPFLTNSESQGCPPFSTQESI
jgi:hypothetical protein